MPFTVNGIGTGLVSVSSKRNVNGLMQYDAMEAVVFLFMPLIPYKMLHILSMQGDQYRSMPLRWSSRLFLKGMCNGWGNGLLLVGGGMSLLLGIIFPTMERAMKQDDWIMVGVFGCAFVLGVILKGLWYLLDGRDRRIKEIIGSHDVGSSDPFDWPDDVARTFVEAILKQDGKSSLMAVADACTAKGEPAKAMLCLRLAQRDPVDAPQAQLACEQLLANATAAV